MGGPYGCGWGAVRATVARATAEPNTPQTSATTMNE
jgi:hypothetical protein